VTLIYFFADLVWVAKVPICVKSPGVIIKVCGVVSIVVSFHPSGIECCRSSCSSLFVSIASHGCHVVFDRSRLLSGISLVYGFHLVGGSEHLVFDFASSGLQDSRATRVSLDWGDRLVHVLLDLDFDSLHYLPERFGDLFLLGC
jgi:hypothetical protein